MEGLAALLEVAGLHGSWLLRWSIFLVPGLGRLFDSLGLKGRSLWELLLILSFRLKTQRHLLLSGARTGRFESEFGVVWSFFKVAVHHFNTVLHGAPFSFGVCSGCPLSFLLRGRLGLLSLLQQGLLTLFDLEPYLLVEDAPLAFVRSVVSAVTELPVVAGLFEFVDAPLSAELFVVGSRRSASVGCDDVFHNFEHLSALILGGSRSHELVKLFFTDHQGLEHNRAP